MEDAETLSCTPEDISGIATAVPQHLHHQTDCTLTLFLDEWQESGFSSAESCHKCEHKTQVETAAIAMLSPPAAMERRLSH